MTTSRQEADQLLLERQERRRATKEKISDRGVTIRPVEPGFALFGFLISLREDLRDRKDTVTRTKCQVRKQAPQSVGALTQSQQQEPLPRYVERDCYGNLSFRVDRGSPRFLLPNDPTTPEFRAAYNVALVDSVAAEPEVDDWSELERDHELQRRQRRLLNRSKPGRAVA
ncbi:hypothetical protein [Bradyrhizobium genosp. P]|uniref:hypothetical protein n=1 Tax=Bradyrhizobium genosp. P TaxID=83641 RepID=UPI003CECFA1D